MIVIAAMAAVGMGSGCCRPCQNGTANTWSATECSLAAMCASSTGNVCDQGITWLIWLH